MFSVQNILKKSIGFISSKFSGGLLKASPLKAVSIFGGAPALHRHVWFSFLEFDFVFLVDGLVNSDSGVSESLCDDTDPVSFSVVSESNEMFAGSI